MKKAIHISSLVFTGFSILSIAYVSIVSMIDPQGTMDLVQVSLPNNDSISSIRGIYGGVGLAITFSLVYLLLRNLTMALSFLSMFWGFYAISRLITLIVDGPLGDFGTQWLIIESVFCLIAISLATLRVKAAK
jgi:hypothetical protein